MRIMNQYQLLLIALASSLVVLSTAFMPLTANSRRAMTFSRIPVLMSDVTEEEVQKPELSMTTEDAASTETEAASDDSESSAPKRKVVRERHTVFVGNLPFDMSDSDLRKLFEDQGTVVELVTIPRKRETQQPRGFAFVDLESDEQIDIAVAALDGNTFMGRELRVMKSLPRDQVEKSPAQPKAPRQEMEGTKKLYVGNIPFEATPEDMKNLFAEYGEILDVFIPTNPGSGTGRGFAFITMKEEAISQAIEGVNGLVYEGRDLVVSEPLPKGEKKAPTQKRPRRQRNTKIYVGNLSFYTVAETLEELFSEFGEVLDCYLPEDPRSGGSRGFGFVTMASADAERAIAEINGCEVDGRVIRVNAAQPKSASKDNDDSNNDEGPMEW